jgi:RNA polymerase sigma-70 factor, ECF subfamily
VPPRVVQRRKGLWHKRRGVIAKTLEALVFNCIHIIGRKQAGVKEVCKVVANLSICKSVFLMEAQMRELTDAELAERSTVGDNAAFEELARRYRNSLTALIRRLVRNPNEVEELLQETLVRSWRNIATVRNPERVHAWLLQVARNCCRDHDRSIHHREQPTEQQTLETYANRYGRTGPSPEADVELREALKNLPRLEGEAIRLFYLRGLSINEIAETTQSPVGTVKSRLFTARHHLRVFLEESRGDE